ncbi:metallophosphoesterase [uncultured Cetobacterium sp.]|uniref:metallophosphoesterase n=1 Tax=uncultured Cetobacterium sp. TaxID=527638 RepID=UPI0026319FBD|nr:metallophosphoesterase [uncultured Cetobacterium sp.]
MIWILQRMLLLMFPILGVAYIFYKIYGSLWYFLFIPVFTFLPFILFYFYRNKRNISLEIFLGHYLFYLNYIIFGALILLSIALIFKIFSIDILREVSYRKTGLHTFIIFSLGILSFWGYRNFKNIDIKNYNIPKELIQKESGLKFAFISDVHLNGKFDGSKLKIAFEKMKDENVELVLIGGDFLDNSYKSITDDIKSIIDETNFKHGIYLVLGNHEYYGGIEENIEYIKNLGINILRDEIVKIEGITIVGRDDRYNKKRKSLDELLKNVDKKSSVIVVDHNPQSLKELGNEKVDLYLSGHTHKGQLFPFNLVVNYMYENSGGYKKIGDTHTYVSSGLGTWMIPYRIGSSSQIMIFK